MTALVACTLSACTPEKSKPPMEEGKNVQISQPIEETLDTSRMNSNEAMEPPVEVGNHMGRTHTRTSIKPESHVNGTHMAAHSKGKNTVAKKSGKGPKIVSVAKNKKIAAGQTALNTRGYAIKVDGVLGSQTAKAVREFQKKNKLKVTGTFDAVTLKKLGVKA